MIKKILLLLFVAIIIIQFIHPKHNIAAGRQANYIGAVYRVPQDVRSILVKACNDCHSNNTRYPWYSKIQPIDWWLDNHVRNGKNGLNFDEFTNKSLRFQYNKMKDVLELVKDNKMPLNSYLWIHKDAILTTQEKAILLDWANGIRDSLQSRYPMDSLVRKKPK
jgi:hypothetical protein